MLVEGLWRIRVHHYAAAEPYFIGSHSGASGAWVSGPKDLAPPEYFWGYENMSTVKGLFCAGDASGASSHKFSSGSHAEGRIAAKAAIKFVLENKDQPKVDAATVEAMSGMIKGAVNIPEGAIKNRLKELPKDKEIITYCATGIRAGYGCLFFTALMMKQATPPANSNPVPV